MADILKALAGATDASGGFTVPDVLSREILALIQAQAVTLPDMQKVEMTSDTLLLPKLTKGGTARWIGEDTAITGADVGFGRTTLSAKKVAALLTVSTELLEDSAAQIAPVVTEQFGKDLANALDAEILTGTGGNFTGIAYTGGTANTQSQSALSWQGLVSASNLILTGGYNYPDTMYVHPNIFRAFRLLTDSQARPIFNAETWGSPLLRDGVIGTVLGMKVKPTIQMQATTGSTAGLYVIGKSGDFGYFSTRRNLQFNKFYNIGTDDVVLQANMRAAFAIKYSLSFALNYG